MSPLGVWILNVIWIATCASLLAVLASRAIPKRFLALRHDVLLAGLLLVLLAPFGAEVGRRTLGSNWSATLMGATPAVDASRSEEWKFRAPSAGTTGSREQLQSATSDLARNQETEAASGILSGNNSQANAGGPQERGAHDVEQSTLAGRLSGAPWSLLILALWLLGTFHLLRKSMRHRRRIANLRRSSAPAGGDSPALWTSVCLAMGIRREPPLARSALVQAPVALGCRHPMVLLPLKDGPLKGAALRGVLIHEAAHLRHGHQWIAELRVLAGQLFWWNPCVSWLRRLLGDVQESISDAHVLQDSGDRHGFVEALLYFAERATAPHLPVLGILDRRQLEGRVRDLLDTDSGRVHLSLPGRALAVLYLTTALTACAITKTSMQPGEALGGSEQAMQEEQDAQMQQVQSDPEEPTLTVRSSVSPPRPGLPDLAQIEAPRLIQGEGDLPPTMVYPPSRKSEAFIEGMAVDGGVSWKGITVYLTLTHDLIAKREGEEKVLWKAQGSFYYDTLGFLDMQMGPSERWVVRLGTEVKRDLVLDALFDLNTGERVEFSPQGAESRNQPLELRSWFGSDARGDRSLRLLIESQGLWSEIHAERFAGIEGAPGLDLGGFDFGTHALAIVFSGRSTHCNGIRLDSAEDQGEQILLRLQRQTYQTGLALGGEASVEWEHPYGLFAIPRGNHRRSIKLEINKQGLIGGPALWEQLDRFDVGVSADALASIRASLDRAMDLNRSGSWNAAEKLAGSVLQANSELQRLALYTLATSQFRLGKLDAARDSLAKFEAWPPGPNDPSWLTGEAEALRLEMSGNGR